MKIHRIIAMAAAYAMCLCSQTAWTMDAEKTSHPVVLMQTSMGDIKIELRKDLAPITVANFLRYVDDGFYEGKIFHRIKCEFMIQGGGFDANMKPASTRPPILNEAQKGLKNSLGTIAMARTNAINSATSQFFINVMENSFLDHVSKDPQEFGYTAFGRVLEGMDVAMAISRVKTGPHGFFRDVPIRPVFILKVKRVDEQSSGHHKNSQEIHGR